MIPQIKEINFGPGTANSYATLHQATVSLQEMGERTVTTQVRIDGDVVPNFDGWAVEFKGEKFVLNVKDPQAMKDNTTRNSLIDLTFVSWPVEELKRYYFFNTVTTAAGTIMPDQYKVPVNLNLAGFVTLFNNVLNYYFAGKIVMDLSPTATYAAEPSVVDIDYTYLWDVLTNVLYNTYGDGARWYISYNSVNDVYTIKVGYAADAIDDHDFEYGYQGGLLKFERQVQDTNIRNILLGRGGEKNLPYRYFKKLDPQNPTFLADPDAIPELANISFDRIRDINFRWYIRGWMQNPNRDTSGDQAWDPGHVFPTYTIDSDDPHYWAYYKGMTDDSFDPVEFVKDEESIEKYGEHWGALDDNDDVYPTIQGIVRSGLGRVDESVAISEITTDDIDAMAKAAAVESNIDGTKVVTKYISANGFAQDTFISQSFTIPSGKTANIDFPESDQKYFAVISESATAAEQANVSIDTQYSSWVVVNESSGTEIPFSSGIPAGTYHCKVTLRASNRNSSGKQVTFGFNGIKMVLSDVNENAWKPTFDIWVKNLWATSKNPNETAQEYAERVWRPILGDRLGNEAKVVFSTGFMSISEDYEFVIAAIPEFDQSKTIYSSDGNTYQSEWKLTLYKSSAEYDATGLYIPNAQATGKPIAGDKFYFLGIDMPHQYVLDAESILNGADYSPVMHKTASLSESADIAPTWLITLDKVRVHTLEDEDYGTTLAERLATGAKVNITDPRFTPGEVLTLYVQSITYIWNEPTKDSPYMVPDIEVLLSDKVVAREGIVSQIQSDINIVKSTYAKAADIETVVRRVATPMFLKKTGEADSSESPTEFGSRVSSKAFRQGDIGGQGWGAYQDGNGKSVYEVDKLVVREEMRVNSLVVNQITYIGGLRIESAANIECTQVVDNGSGYQCFFDQKRGSVGNHFRVGDIAFGQVFDENNIVVKYYKRKVVAIGYNYITLAKYDEPWIVIIDEEEGITETRHTVDGSGVPAAKDVIVQFGSITETDRQYVIITDVIGGGYQRMLADLNHAAATGREYYFAGRQASTGDRWFVGNKDAGKYAEWKDGELTISGRLAVTSQVAKGDGSYVGLTAYLNSLQDQVDGNVQNWFEEGVPSPLAENPTAAPNYPASTWPTVADKNKHLGDLYYNTLTGKSYRYELVSGNYVWGIITDEEISKALRDAAAALAAAATAQSAADAANQRLNSWAADGYISPTEKKEVKDEIARIDSDHSVINSAYTTYGLGTPTAYNNAYTAYRAQLVTLSADTPENIPIPDTFAANMTAYYNQRTAALQAIDTAVKSGLDTLGTAIAGLDYLKEALGQDTVVSGGLILSSLIQLGRTESSVFNVYSGINGLMNSGRQRVGGGIAAWYGGPMSDKDDLDTGISAYAKSIFRFDGSGYLAGGNIYWNSAGYGGIPGITWSRENNQDVVTIGGNVKLASASGDTVTELINLVRTLGDMFVVENYTEGGESKKRLKVNTIYSGLYTEGFLSAAGLNSGGGGGGSDFDEAAMWQALGGTYGTNEVVSISHLPMSTLDARYAVAGNYVPTSRKVNDKALSSDITLTLDDIANGSTRSLANYLPLAGGTLTGALRIADSANSNSDIQFIINGSEVGRVYGNSDGRVSLMAGSTQVSVFASTTYPIFRYNGTDYTIWHSGNDGAGSGLDADLLDGKHYSDIFADVKHVAQTADISGMTGTIAEVKAALFAYFATQRYGVGDNVRVSQSLVDLWDNDSASIISSSSATFIKISAYQNSADYTQMLVGSYGSKNLYVFGSNGGTWTKNTLAYTTDNVASATKLQTARTIWGQSFDGTANVTGDMTDVGSITMTGRIAGTGGMGDGVWANIYINGDAIYTTGFNYVTTGVASNLSSGGKLGHTFGKSIGAGNMGNIVFNYSDSGSNDNFVGIGLHSKDNILRIYYSGNVGIGVTSNPAHKLDVIGNIHTTGSFVLNNNQWLKSYDSAGTGLISLVGLTTNGVMVGAPSGSNTTNVWLNGGNVHVRHYDATYSQSGGDWLQSAVFTTKGQLIVGGVQSSEFTFHVNGTSYFSTGVTMNSTLSVGGNTTIGGTLTVGTASANKDTTLNGALSVTGNSAIGGTLTVTGATTLNNSLSVGGISTFSDSLKIKTNGIYGFDANSSGLILSSSVVNYSEFIGSHLKIYKILTLHHTPDIPLDKYFTHIKSQVVIEYGSMSGFATYSGISDAFSVYGDSRLNGTATITGLANLNGGAVIPSGKTLKIGPSQYIEWDNDATCWKLNGNLAVTGFVSAGGVEPGSGSEFDESAMWLALAGNDTDAQAKLINPSHLAKLNVSGGSAESGKYISAISYSNGTFSVTKESLPASLKNPYYLQVNDRTTNEQGAVTHNNTYDFYDGSATKTIRVLRVPNGNYISGITYSSGVLQFSYGVLPATGVTSITAGTGLSGGTITSTGTISLDVAGTKTALGLGTMAYEAAANYLPLTGGTLTGSLAIADSANSNSNIQFIVDGSEVGRVYGNSDGRVSLMAGSTQVSVFASTTYPIFRYNGTDYTIWHSGNDGAGSGLDADLLDGKHYSDIFADVKHVAQTVDLTNATGTVGELKGTLLTYFATQGYGIGDSIRVSKSLISNWDDDSASLYSTSPVSIVKFGGYGLASSYGQWLVSGYGDENLLVIGRSNSSWTKKTLAFTDSNVASATKLQTARTIWGQSFDGTANVTGDMTDVGSITMTGRIAGTGGMGDGVRANIYINGNASSPTGFNYVTTGVASNLSSGGKLGHTFGKSIGAGNMGNIVFNYSDSGSNDNFVGIGLHSKDNVLRIYYSGNVGIGVTSNPAHKLDVIGNIHTTGSFVLNNNQWLKSYDSAGTGLISLVGLTTNGVMVGAPSGSNTTNVWLNGGNVYVRHYDATYSQSGGDWRQSAVFTTKGQLIVGGVQSSEFTFHVSGTSYFSTGVTMNSTLSVGGNTTIGGTFTVGTASANKATTLYGTLYASGATTLASTLTVSGAAGFNSTMEVAGLATFNSGLTLGYTYPGDNQPSTLTWDNSAKAWHLHGNFYCDGFLSSGGLNSGQGETGLIDYTGVLKIQTATTSTANGVQIGNSYNYVAVGADRPSGKSYKFYVNGDMSFFSGNVDIAGDRTVQVLSSVKLYVNGSVYASSYLNSSDARLKTNIEQMEQAEAIKIVMALKPSKWEWNDNSTLAGQRSAGFIAQEVLNVMPCAVHGEDYFSLNYSAFVAPVVATLQSHEERIKVLEKEIERLRAN